MGMVLVPTTHAVNHTPKRTQTKRSSTQYLRSRIYVICWFPLGFHVVAFVILCRQLIIHEGVWLLTNNNKTLFWFLFSSIRIVLIARELSCLHVHGGEHVCVPRWSEGWHEARGEDNVLFTSQVHLHVNVNQRTGFQRNIFWQRPNVNDNAKTSLFFVQMQEGWNETREDNFF